MKLEYFQYLNTIAQTNSISLAAERLYISQQALSKSIKAFEEELETTLFIRTNQGVIFTPEGEYVLQNGKKILELAENINLHFKLDKMNQITGALRIMLPHEIRDQFFSKKISIFYQRYPGIQLEFIDGDENEILHALKNKEIDLGFFYIASLDGMPLTEIKSPLAFVPIAKHRYSIWVSQKSKYSKLNSISLQTLDETPIITLKSVWSRKSHISKLLNHFNFSQITEVDSSSILYQFIVNNAGIAIVTKSPEITQNLSSMANCNLISINNNAYATFGYAYHKEYFDNPCIDILLQLFTTG